MELQTRIFGTGGEILDLFGNGRTVEFKARGTTEITGSLAQTASNNFIEDLVEMLRGNKEIVTMMSNDDFVEFEVVPYAFHRKTDDLFVLSVGYPNFARRAQFVEYDLNLLDLRRLMNHFFFPEMIHFQYQQDGGYKIFFPNGYRDRQNFPTRKV